MKKLLGKEKGITLIALVITIIVLLILAGVAIISLTGENGVITKAVTAKEKTKIAEVIEKAKLDITGIQSANEGKLTTEDLKGILDEYFNDVPEEITAEDITTVELTTKDGKYKIKISDIYNGKLEVASGEMSVSKLKVGDYIKYGDKLTKQSYVTNSEGEPNTGYETSQTFNTDTTTLWQVINKTEHGNVEIVAVKNTLSVDGTSGLYLKGQTGFLKSEDVLNNLCSKLYENPAYGTARSITIDDINNLTKFDPKTDAQGYNEAYTYKIGGPYWNKEDDAFKYATGESPVTVENTCYYYKVDENMPLYDTLMGESKTYKGDYEEENYPMFYWMANRCVFSDDYYHQPSVRGVGAGAVSCGNLIYLYFQWEAEERSLAYGVRPIVSLSSSVKVDTSDASKDGSEQGKAWVLK